tara:strand:+ start:67 stop:621 length:555 start_codon:yes stop_codon:yes gene_type:complete
MNTITTCLKIINFIDNQNDYQKYLMAGMKHQMVKQINEIFTSLMVWPIFNEKNPSILFKKKITLKLLAAATNLNNEIEGFLITPSKKNDVDLVPPSMTSALDYQSGSTPVYFIPIDQLNKENFSICSAHIFINHDTIVNIYFEYSNDLGKKKKVNYYFKTKEVKTSSNKRTRSLHFNIHKKLKF